MGHRAMLLERLRLLIDKYLLWPPVARVLSAHQRRFLTDRCQTSQCMSTVEHYPSGSVVARILLTANPSIYTPADESIAHGRREKEMIQPHALV
jgi:hypothetical protein